MGESFIALLKLFGTIGSTAADISKASDASERNKLLLAFQQALIQGNTLLATVQAENQALLQANRDLQEKIAAVQKWDTEKSRYKLAPAYHGSMVYALLREKANDEPPHYLCTNCFKGGKPSILQLANDGGMSFFVCPICKAKAQSGYRGGVAPKYAEDLLAPKA
jgi:hypothetical protein